MSKRRQPIYALVLVALALPLLGCPNFGSMMRAYGFTELRPPSTLLAPGALVAVKKRQPFSAVVVCRPAESLGTAWQPALSPTASSELRKYNGKSFDLEANLVKQIRAEAAFHSISGISISIDNASIVELQDTDVINNMRYRSATCKQAVQARLNAGYEITMIASGLSGDVTYNVYWDAGAKIDVQAKVATLSQLAVRLGGGIDHLTESTISAKSLMWGVRDDAYLMQLSMPPSRAGLVPKNTPVFSPGGGASLTPEVDEERAGLEELFKAGPLPCDTCGPG